MSVALSKKVLAVLSKILYELLLLIYEQRIMTVLLSIIYTCYSISTSIYLSCGQSVGLSKKEVIEISFDDVL